MLLAGCEEDIAAATLLVQVGNVATTDGLPNIDKVRTIRDIVFECPRRKSKRGLALE